MSETPIQYELANPGPLLDAFGNINQVGWSRQPVLDCNLEQANFYRIHPLQRFRIKRWDYYGVTTLSFFFSVTLAHLGYAGQVFAYFVDFESGEHTEATVTIPFGSGILLPRNSTEGESHYRNSPLSLQFDVQSEERHLMVEWPGFAGKGLAANLQMEVRPDHESMVIVIPFTHNRFYYNRKINCIPVDGWVEFGSERLEISSKDSLANLDWGRGMWPYNSFWVWASESGFLQDGRTLGLNFGFGFGDTSKATENAIILNGKVHKLGKVHFEYDSTNFMQPWKLTSPDDRLQLIFEPFIERVARTNLLLITSEVHQMFGRYSGKAVTDEGEVIHVDGLVGWAEEHHARW
jgi:hypothetical protein